MTNLAAGGITLPPPPPPRWDLGDLPDPEQVDRLQGELSLPRPLCAVLCARGLSEPEAAKGFLRPTLEALTDPSLLADSGVAVSRILKGIADGETILVHGDYDVDGICAAALLSLWLRRLGGNVVPFVPHRLTDGYDLGPAGLAAAEASRASLIVTCDSGISAHAIVEEARGRGIDVIITDHHTPPPTLPAAVAVVNPNRADCPHPGTGLCGAGVAFALCRLLADARGVSQDELLPHLDLVALATVADLVPLLGENRILVRFGLKAIEHTRKPGLRALLEVAGISEGRVDAGAVGYVLAPRLNAAGRMGAAATALRLLLTESETEARTIARELNALNEERQAEDRRTLDEALALLAGTFDAERDFGVVLAGDGWHPGVIGIVASRVVERIHRPTVLLAMGAEGARGSARSIPGVHLYDAVAVCAPHLRRYGGHRQAAGMDIDPENLTAFRASFNEAVRSQLGGVVPPPVLRGDAPLPLEEATEELHHFLEYLGPFGIGNPRPVFWARGVHLADAPRSVGSGHLKLRLGQGSGALDAIGFGLAHRVDPGSLGRGPVDALFQLRENEFRGRVSLQARLRDVRPASP